jgi:excisionase family DNA binding protein
MGDNPDNDDIARAEAARRGSPFLNTAQTAHYLRISIRTLESLTEKGEGPPFRPHGRQKCFHIAEVEAWSKTRKRTSSRRRKSRAKP